MNIRPLSLRPNLGEGSFNVPPNNGAPAASGVGRLGCIPWPLYQAPGHEHWRIDSILVNNWGERDAIYSITVEASDYGPTGTGRAAVPVATAGLRYREAFATTGRSTIRWGKLIGPSEDHRILGPFWVEPLEWLCGAAIPGFTISLVNCTVSGWAFS